MTVKVDKKVSSAESFMGKSTIFGRDGDHNTPYMTRYWFGRLRLHVFHRGDQDPDHHDHPWYFVTFPLTSYVEEVVSPSLHQDVMEFHGDGLPVVSEPRVRRNIVRAFRFTYRSATHCHRVLGRYSGMRYGTPQFDDGKIITFVWRGVSTRRWGFLKYRDDRYCWTHWKEYVFGGGKDAPCSL